MSLLLKQYIKNYLLEAASTAIAMPARFIDGEFQHQLGASYQNDMTSLNDEEVLVKVLENVGNNCFISFIDKYDDNIPRLEVSPDVSYDTPHGNYCYPLTEKNLKDIIEKSRIGEASFAFDRAYFHLFKKSNNINSIDISRDGSSNYKGDSNKDLETIISTALMFLIAKSPDNFNKTEIESHKGNIESKIKRIIDSINNIDSFVISLTELSNILNDMTYLNNNIVPEGLKRFITSMLKKVIVSQAFSKSNKFWLTQKEDMGEFHVLYFACWLLSMSISNEFYSDSPDEDDNKIMGPVFTMLLNSIDIDFINDEGSTTLHDNEPVQAVYLNSSKKESIVLIGTFNNIFQYNKKNIDDLILFAATGKNQNSIKKITMNKIVDVIEKNPNLSNLFDSSLFVNPKFEGDISLATSINHIPNQISQLTQDTSNLVSIPFYIKEDAIDFTKSNEVIDLIFDDISSEDYILVDVSLQDSFKNKSDDNKIIALYNLDDSFSIAFLKEDIINPVLQIQKKRCIFKLKNPKKTIEIESFINEFEPKFINKISSSEEDITNCFNILRTLKNFANKINEI